MSSEWKVNDEEFLAKLRNAKTIAGREVHCNNCDFVFIDDTANNCFSCGSKDTTATERQIPVNFRRLGASSSN